MDRNVKKRIRATCEFSFHTSLRFPSTQKGEKNKISSQDKRKDIPRKFESRIWTETSVEYFHMWS